MVLKIANSTITLKDRGLTGIKRTVAEIVTATDKEEEEDNKKEAATETRSERQRRLCG